jgi:hypothetical protein
MSDASPASEGTFSQQGSQVKADRAQIPDEPVAEAPVELQRPTSQSGRYLVTVLIAAGVSGFVATIVAVVISLGIGFWMAGSPGGRGDRLMQEGKLTVGQGERVVFYAEPFAGPPKLELEGQMVFITLKEQKADHFTIQSAIHGEVRWRAEGMRVK